MIKSVFVIGFYTLLSRVLGFVRDILVASMLGAGAQSDAFFVAFRLPNLLRRLFAEGAFNAAFVPMYARLIKDGGLPAARRFAGEAMSALLAILLAVTVLFEICMPWFMVVYAPGFTSDPEKFDLTVALSRITFVYLLFISLTTLFAGSLNSVGRFAAAAAAPILLNLVLVLSLLYLSAYTATPADALAWGVAIAGLLQFLWLGWCCHRAGILPTLHAPRLTPDVKRLLWLAAPVALGAGVAQINMLVDSIVASFIPNAISYLQYASRVSDLPLGIIGTAIGTVLLPTLSRHISAGEHEAAASSLNRALELAMLLSLPAAAALMVIGHPIAIVLFERGAFGPEQSAATGATLIAFASGIPAFVLVKLFAPGFFAAHDTKTPVKIALWCLAANLALNLALMVPFQQVGIALSTSIASWLNAVLLGWGLWKRRTFVPDTRLKARALRIICSVLGMSAALAAMYFFTREQFAVADHTRTLLLAGFIAVGGSLYGVLVLVTRAADLREIKGYLRRNRNNTAAS